MGGDRTPNESLKLEAAKAAVGPSARLWEVTWVPAERRRHHQNVTGNDDLYADGAATSVNSEGTTVGRGRMKRRTWARETSKNRRHPLVSHQYAGQGNGWQPDRRGLDTGEAMPCDHHYKWHHRRATRKEAEPPRSLFVPDPALGGSQKSKGSFSLL
jgi:hypothetical protein